MIRILTIMLAFALGGCSVMANSRCFTQRTVVIPDRELVLANVNNGQAGRDIAAAVFDGKIDDVTAMIKRDNRLFTTEAVYDKDKFSERPQGQYGDLLSFAISRCDIAMEKHLLDLGMPVNGTQIGDALTLALLADGPEMAELLLQRGASPDPQKLDGDNAMKEITSFRHLGGVMMLIRHGLDVNWEDKFGYTHLQTSVGMEEYRIAEALIEKGANPWHITGDGGMPVQKLANPLILDKPEENEARIRILAKAEADAKAKGLRWPPPDFKTVRKMVLLGKWPTKEMLDGGVPPVSAIALAHMREQFSKEIEQ
jgi:ankyrin repeat protein